MSRLCLAGGKEVGEEAACVFWIACRREQVLRYLLPHLEGENRWLEVTGCSVQRSWQAPGGRELPQRGRCGWGGNQEAVAPGDITEEIL